MKNPSSVLHDWYYFLCIVEFLRWAVALINFRSRKHFRCFQNKSDSFCGRETERETYTVKRKMEAELKDMIDDLESLKRSLPDSSLHASINKVISIYQFGSTIFLLFIFYNVIHNYELNLIHDQYLFINWLFRLSSVRIFCCQLQCILRYVKFEIEYFNFKNKQIINNIYMQISFFFFWFFKLYEGLLTVINMIFMCFAAGIACRKSRKDGNVCNCSAFKSQGFCLLNPCFAFFLFSFLTVCMMVGRSLYSETCRVMLVAGYEFWSGG